MVAFFGLRHDVAHLLANAHIFSLINPWEALPGSILEAMRAGLPIIASKVGGVKEAVVNGESGFLVPKDNLVALRSRPLVCMADPNLRQKIGKVGRRRYETKLTCERVFEKPYVCMKKLLRILGKLLN